MKRFFLVFLVLAITSVHAHASGTNAQDVEKLRTISQNLLDYISNTYNAMGLDIVHYEGEINVTPHDTYYTITYPHIKLKNLKAAFAPDLASKEGEAEKPDVTFDIGVITINAMRDERPGHWKTVITYPSEMTMMEGEEKTFKLNIENQRSIGLLNENLGYSTKMDLNLSGISFDVAGEEDIGVSLGGIQFYMNYDENEGGTFTGPTHILLNNLVLAPPKQEETIRLGEIKVDVTMSDIILPTLKEYQDKISKYSEILTAAQKPGYEPKPEDMQELFAMLFDMYDFGASGFKVTYSGKDIQLTSDNLDNAFSLGSGFYSLGGHGFGTEEGSLSMKFGYHDLVPAAKPRDKTLQPVIPESLSLNINLDNIPYTSLGQIAQTTISSVSENPDSAQMAMMGTMMRLPAVFGQAGTQLMMDGGAKNETYTASLHGEAVTDLTAMMGFTAQFDSVFEGMDDLINMLSPENEETNTSRPQANILQALQKWKAIGEAVTRENGKTAYKFDLQAIPEGKFLINGQDASAVLQ